MPESVLRFFISRQSFVQTALPTALALIPVHLGFVRWPTFIWYLRRAYSRQPRCFNDRPYFDGLPMGGRFLTDMLKEFVLLF